MKARKRPKVNVVSTYGLGIADGERVIEIDWPYSGTTRMALSEAGIDPRVVVSGRPCTIELTEGYVRASQLTGDDAQDGALRLAWAERDAAQADARHLAGLLARACQLLDGESYAEEFIGECAEALRAPRKAGAA